MKNKLYPLFQKPSGRLSSISQITLLTFLLLFTLTAAVFAQAAPLPDKIKTEITRAASHYNSGNPLEAINILENIRRQGFTENPEINQLLAKAYVQHAYLKLKENTITSDEFIELNKKAYELDPTRPEASYNIACTYAKKGQEEEGIKWLERSYPIIIQEKYKQLLEAIRNDRDLDNLRLSPGFNDTFPKLAVQIPMERSKQKREQFEEKNIAKTEQPKQVALRTVPETTFELLDAGMYQPRKFIKTIIGYVPNDVDISYDHIAKEVMEKGVSYALENPPDPKPGLPLYINVCLRYQGKEYKPFKKASDNWWGTACCDVYGATRQIVKDKLSRDGDRILGIEWQSFLNPLFSEREKKDGEERRRAEMLERQRKEEEALKDIQMAEEKERQETLKRLNEFVAKNGVKEWVSIETLSTNPFIYEGNTVAIEVDFQEMSSPTQGHFMRRDVGMKGNIVVSDIPKGLFTSKKRVVLAGRVLGKTEIRLPLLGTVFVPHLKFVGVHFCEDWLCRDIIPTKKK